MKDWPCGSHLLLETETRKETKLCALGCKHNNKRMMMFVFTKGAGHTEKGVPCIATWKDANGNTCIREVPRPHVCSKCCAHCNTIDVHNQGRQGDLSLESCWVVRSGCLRLVTALFGMTVTDSWKACRHQLSHQHSHKNISLVDFASILAKDCLENKHSTVCDLMLTGAVVTSSLSSNTNPNGPGPGLGADAFMTPERHVCVQAGSSRKRRLSFEMDHKLVPNDEREAAKSRRVRGRCQNPMCNLKTIWFCQVCIPKGANKAWCCDPVKQPHCGRHHQTVAQLQLPDSEEVGSGSSSGSRPTPAPWLKTQRPNS